jgi:2-oxoglutarate dehydrogenase complex dehydrogenase (E1) component-like enzyme
VKIALDYRQEFNKDVALDLVGFRRLGHNEATSRATRSPVMYARVKAHPGVRQSLRSKLIRENIITEAELGQMTEQVVEKYAGILQAAKPACRRKTEARILPAEIATMTDSIDFGNGNFKGNSKTGFGENISRPGKLSRQSENGRTIGASSENGNR